jgi:hypothetical protein
MKVTPALSYEERIVAFVDILGFRSLVAKLPSDPEFHRNLHGALTAIKSVKSFAGRPNTAQKEVEASVFSDSIVISGAPSQLFTVIWTCVNLQSQLLSYGVVTRGGISRGRTYHKEDLLYGEGIIKAYDLEFKTAIYPRVVVDPALVADVHDVHRQMLLNLDADGLWYTDPFSLGVLPGNSGDLLEDGWDPHLAFLETFAKRVDEEIKAAKDAGIAAKWGWMKSKVQEALAFHQKHGNARMWHIMKLTGAFDKKPTGETESSATPAGQG